MQSRPRFFFLILMLALAIRLGAATYWHRTAAAEGTLFRLGDSHSYWVLAGQIARGLPYEYGSSESRIFRAPLYPLAIALFTRIGDEQAAVWWTRVIGCCMGTLAVALIGRLAFRLGGLSASYWAGLLAAVYPGAVGMSIAVLSEAIFLPLMLSHLLLWQSAWKATGRRTFWLAALAGVTAGAATLARPSWILFTGFALAFAFEFYGLQWLWSRGGRAWNSSNTFRDLAKHSLIFGATILGVCLTMSPWWIRNALITGKFVPTTLQVGPSLYDGLHAGATGASDEGMAFMKSISAEQIETDQQQAGPLPGTLETRINARAQSKALGWASENPMQAIKLAGRKFLRTWSLWPDGGEMGSTALRLAITISSFAVLMLALSATLGLYRDRRLLQSGWEEAICWVPCLYFTLLHMVFVGSIRYREPALCVLVALAGCALAHLCSRITPTALKHSVDVQAAVATCSAKREIAIDPDPRQ